MAVLVDERVSLLKVGQLQRLIQEVVRKEIADFFEHGQELIAESPPIRKIDTVIEKMKATGKYSEEFLGSLEKGMKLSKSFE